mgnify:CR=1 FL=1
MQAKFTGSRFAQMFGLKAFVTIVLVLLFFIPLQMISSTISERSFRAKEVAREIAGKWAQAQAVQGPFLVIPGERVNPASDSGEMQYRKVVLLPDQLTADARVNTEERSRGIFDTVVYTTEVKLSGDFTAEAFAKAGFEAEGWRLRLDQAVLALGIDDLRGIQGDLTARWGGAALATEPGMPAGALLPKSGIHWPLAGQVRLQDEGTAFEVAFTLRGSSRLAFLPVGKRSVITLQGNWPSPSFNGHGLPVSHDVREDGFSARWDIFHLSRPLPQSWTSDARQIVDLKPFTVGAAFLQPVNFYLLSQRSVKYGLLIVALLFLTFFLFEVLAGIALHPLQYLMVGGGLVLFFLSLVSFAEVIGFAAAYGLSAALVAAMVSLYAAAILKRRLWAALLFAMIAGLYGLLYLILNLEEAALLAGTLLLFAALGLTMYVTRHVDWFNVGKTPPAPEENVEEAAL